MLACQLAHFGLRHTAKRKQRAAELLLRQAKKEIRLVLRAIGWALQQPSPARLIKLHTRIVSCRDCIGPNLLRHREQLIELQMIVAETARNRRASREILL